MPLMTINILEVYVDDIYSINYTVDVIYINFKKAFDSVSHQRLLGKMKSCGIEQVTYLSDLPAFYTKGSTKWCRFPMHGLR